MDGVGGRPLGVERDGLASFGEIYHRSAAGETGAGAVALGIPAYEYVVLAGEDVGGQFLRLANDKRLVGHCAGAAVGVEVDGVGGRPLGVERHGFTVSCKVGDALAVGVGGAATVGLRVPASEDVARAGEGVGGQFRAGVGSHALVDHRARAAVGVEVYGVALHPLGVERDGGGQGDACTVDITGAGAIKVGGPSVEHHPVQAGECAGREVGGAAFQYGLAGHRALTAEARVEVHEVIVAFRAERNGVGVRVCCRTASIGKDAVILAQIRITYVLVALGTAKLLNLTAGRRRDGQGE